MTVLEVLKFQVAYVPLVEERSTHHVVQRNDGLVLTVLMVILMTVLFFYFFCRAQFMLLRARSVGCRLLSSSEQGALAVTF